jgi:hypothetical protein
VWEVPQIYTVFLSISLGAKTRDLPAKYVDQEQHVDSVNFETRRSCRGFDRNTRKSLRRATEEKVGAGTGAGTGYGLILTVFSISQWPIAVTLCLSGKIEP